MKIYSLIILLFSIQASVFCSDRKISEKQLQKIIKKKFSNGNDYNTQLIRLINDTDCSNNDLIAYKLKLQKENIDLKKYINIEPEHDGITPLIAAVSTGLIARTKLVLDLLEPDINLVNSKGETALLYALNNGDDSMATFLLDNGASPFINGEKIKCNNIVMSDLQGWVDDAIDTINPCNGLINCYVDRYTNNYIHHLKDLLKDSYPKNPVNTALNPYLAADLIDIVNEYNNKISFSQFWQLYKKSQKKLKAKQKNKPNPKKCLIQ